MTPIYRVTWIIVEQQKQRIFSSADSAKKFVTVLLDAATTLAISIDPQVVEDSLYD